ncbi:MAG: glycosyltransferase [Draconibacterium sp.]
MPKILVDVWPARGHFNGSLKMILLLKDAGFEIVYLNMSLLKDDLKKNGFQNVTTSQFTRPFEFFRWRLSLKLFINALLEFNKNKYTEKKSHEFEQFKQFIHQLSPDLVFLDDQNMLKAIIYELCGIPVICIDSMPDSSMYEDIPPYTSYFVPDNSFLSNWYCKFLWGKKIIQNKLRLKIMQINMVGMDDYSTISKLAQQNKVNLVKRLDFKRGCGFGIKNTPHLIVAPADFDFPHHIKKEVYNIGPLINIKREGEIDKPRYNVLLKSLTVFKNLKKGFVVFCSLGTITSAFQKSKRTFLHRMLKTAELNSSDFFVLSAGKEFDVSKLFPIPENMFVFDFVPQVDLLQHCDIMINHGGMNTITECIFCEVPMLVYPLSPYWDQPGNSARVVYHGLGLNGKINKDSAKTISNKLNHIKSNYSYYKKNVLAMKAKFEEKNNSYEVVEIIENILKEDKQV